MVLIFRTFFSEVKVKINSFISSTGYKRYRRQKNELLTRFPNEGEKKKKMRESKGLEQYMYILYMLVRV